MSSFRHNSRSRSEFSDFIVFKISVVFIDVPPALESVHS
nr:MAG TPA: hypothetical protein [Caudoviricetes sp.]